MIGSPKFELGDIVHFTIKSEDKLGEICIVDRYGTFEDSSDVCYDIYVKEDNTIYKHVNEKYLK